MPHGHAPIERIRHPNELPETVSAGPGHPQLAVLAAVLESAAA
ncbi:hypothetical protein [Kitasatospora kazusensis]